MSHSSRWRRPYEGRWWPGRGPGDQRAFCTPKDKGERMKRTTRLLPLGALVLVGVLVAAFGPARATTSEADASGPLVNQVLAHAVDVYLGRAQLGPGQFQVSSGPLEAALQAVHPMQAAGVPSGRPNSKPDTQGCQKI